MMKAREFTRWNLPVLLILLLFLSSSGIASIVSEAEVLYRLYGLNFSPFVDGQSPDWGTQISEEQLRERMAIIKDYTEWIRTFGCTDGLEKAGRIAQEMGLKAAIGAWLGSDLAANERQINSLIEIANAGEADMVIVGSEVLLRGDLTEAQLIDYINSVKAEIPVTIPVTTADVYGELIAHPAVIAVVDILFANYYPYWEGIEVELAMAYIHRRHQEVVACSGGKPVFVSEAGWPSRGNRFGEAIPSPDNAAFFFLNFASWARANDVPYFYFEAFDESWKVQNEGPQGAHWGVWDKYGDMKPGMERVFNDETMEDNWSGTYPPGGPGDPIIEFTHVPAYGTFHTYPFAKFDQLRGQVRHVPPIEHNVAVYINVNGAWWTKPYADSRRVTNIENNGSWKCPITTGGIDETATVIVAYLIPEGYDPPVVLGDPSLPPELEQFPKVEHARLRLAITPPYWDYGYINVNSYSDRIFTLQNDETATMELDVIIIGDSDFRILNGGGFSLEPGGTRDIVVRFEPSAYEYRFAKLVLINDIEDVENLEIPLFGNGISPDIAMYTYWDYGNVPAGSYSDKVFVVLNSGGSTLEATVIPPPPGSAFEILNGAGSFSLEPGYTHNILVRFSPPSCGYESDSFRLISNVPGMETLDIILEGNRSRDLILNLRAGWNMISVPGEPEISSIPELVVDTPVLPFAYTWDPVARTYIMVYTLDFCLGYWLAAVEDCALTIPYRPYSRLECPISQGWNMVGSICCTVPVSGILSDPPCMLPYVYTWDPDTGSYITVTDIEPGKGHWVASTCDSTLIMDCLAASAAQNQEFVETTKPTWKSLLTVESKGRKQDLIFGMHPSASGGFDELLDRPIPPSPFADLDDGRKNGNSKLSGVLEAVWLVEDPIFPMLYESYVKVGTQGIWRLSVELPKPGKINWGNLPDGYRFILHYNERAVDMKVKEFLPLPLGKHKLTLVLDSR